MCGGSSVNDDCGACNGLDYFDPDTGLLPNGACACADSETGIYPFYDCNGECGGSAENDVCTVCGGSNNACESAGQEFDGYICPEWLTLQQIENGFIVGPEADECGVCNGNNSCLDECGTPFGQCNTYCDCNDTCNGEWAIGCDDECAEFPTENDDCGVCGGLGCQDENGNSVDCGNGVGDYCNCDGAVRDCVSE